MATQNEIANQMVQQLRILDPSVSGEIGTPERKIIDTVAQAITDVQVDLTSLNGALDIDSKYGTDLDNFLGLFGFGRQVGSKATGTITFSRSEASNMDIRVAAATQVAGSVTTNGVTRNLVFETTTDALIEAGTTSVTVPIRAATEGSDYNLGANTITQFVTAGIYGITGVTNETPTRNGLNPETDLEFKVRFRNTVFRNLAGTYDQYLALAVAGAFTNKANVVGPMSRYREYIQVPYVDDASPYEIDGGNTINPNGAANEYTTALSSIPYSVHTYDTVTNFVSDSQSGRYYTEGIDYVINYGDDADKDTGDAYRLFAASLDDEPSSATTRPNVTFTSVYEGDNEEIDSARPGDVVLFEHTYLSSASRNDYENNINNCVDIYINGVNETAATTNIIRPSLGSKVFVDNSSSKFHFDNFRRIGEPDARPVIGHIFIPLFQTPIESVPDSILVTIDDAVFTYYEGEHYWGVIDVSEIGGTVRARTGLEWFGGRRGESEGDTYPAYTGDYLYEASGDTPIPIDYTFDRNVADLQAAIENSKQITTDPLVHQATRRYFKFFLNVMYASGYSPTTVNTSIVNALNNFLENQYFGATIQLSDVLQTVHNVAGVDNVRWTTEIDSDIPCVMECNDSGVHRFGIISDRYVVGEAPSTDEVQQWYLIGDNPPGVAEVQVLTVDSASGNYALTFMGEQTVAINFNASAATVESALESLSTIGSGNVSVSGGPGDAGGTTPYIVTFTGALDKRDVPLLEPDNFFLGGTAAVTVSTAGETRPVVTYDITFGGDTATVNWNSSAAEIEAGVQFYIDAGLTVTGTGTPADPFTITWTDNNPKEMIEFTVNNVPLNSGNYTYSQDFTLRDNELPSLPSGALSTDTAAGIVIRTRAQNTWNAG